MHYHSLLCKACISVPERPTTAMEGYHIYVCIYTCMYAYIYIYIYTHIHICI